MKINISYFIEKWPIKCNFRKPGRFKNIHINMRGRPITKQKYGQIEEVIRINPCYTYHLFEKKKSGVNSFLKTISFFYYDEKLRYLYEIYISMIISLNNYCTFINCEISLIMSCLCKNQNWQSGLPNMDILILTYD